MERLREAAWKIGCGLVEQASKLRALDGRVHRHPCRWYHRCRNA